jgi:Flp pilus assembly protein TadG
VVEFGLLALLFTLILFGIGDFGLLLNGWVAVSSSAREGARRASVGAHVVMGPDGVPGVIDSARQFAPVPGVDPTQVDVLVHYAWQENGLKYDVYFCSRPGLVTSCDPTPQARYPTPGSPVPPANATVTITVTASTFEVITPLVRPFFGCDGTVAHCRVPITSSTSMRYEGS